MDGLAENREVVPDFFEFDRIEKFNGEIEAEIRRRLVADRGAEAMAKTLRKPLPEDVEKICLKTSPLRHSLVVPVCK